MLKKQVRQNFCYKLMLEMALYDVLTLPLTALLPGIYSMNGYMFCSFPVLSYMTGGVIFRKFWVESGLEVGLSERKASTRVVY